VLAGGLATVLAALLAYGRVRSHDRERAYAQVLVEREAFRRAVLDSVTEPMVVLDGDGLIVASNAAWATLRGAPDDAGVGDGDRGESDADDQGLDVGRDYLEVLSTQARGAVEDLAAGLDDIGGDAHGAQVGPVEVDVPVDSPGGRRWFAVRLTPLRGGRGGSVVLHSDVTERKRSEAELELKATHDTLTGLLNRFALEEEVARALQQARVREAPLAALFIDLDGFKPVNDTYGHGVGDDVLRAVAQRITGAVRTSDRVARLGGDEFVVLVGPLNDPADAERTAARILRSFESPVEIGPHRIAIGASIGVAVVDSPLGIEPGALIELADQAMYRSKERGGRTYSLAD
jgi:diguanylate cyclase (GGDEF)-like protein